MKKRVIEAPLALTLFSREEADVGRRRYQAPEPFKDGNFWVIRVREDALGEDGRKTRTRPRYLIGPCVGPMAMTYREAKREAADKILKTLNNYAAVPKSVMTFEAFVAQKFQPGWVEMLKHAGKEHYKYCLKKAIPALGSMRIRDIETSDIQRMIAKLEEKGLSPKTISHVKTAVVTVFNFAKNIKYYSGDNPAEAVRLPETISPERYAYSFEEAQFVLDELEPPEQDMAFLSLTTSLNVAELCGLRSKRLNLTDKVRFSAGEAIPPYSLLVRENYYRNRWGTVKRKKRLRTVPLTPAMVARLEKILDRQDYTGPDDPVFVSRNGTPLDAHNINNRVFKSVSDKLGVPVTWHIFRHSAATFMEALDMPLADREKMMGHANASMTLHYTHSDIERRRRFQNEVAERLAPKRERMMKQLMEQRREGPAQ